MNQAGITGYRKRDYCVWGSRLGNDRLPIQPSRPGSARSISSGRAGLPFAVPSAGRLARTIQTAVDGAGAAGLFDSATQGRSGPMHAYCRIFSGDA